MRHPALACIVVFLFAVDCGILSAEEHKPAAIAIHSVSVDLPPSTESFPAGPGVDLAEKCLICHSAGMVLRQPPLSKDQWKAVINKMRTVYGAPIDDTAVDPLSNYFAKMSAEAGTH